MSPDSLIIQTADERPSKPEQSPLELFAASLHYELHQSAYGLAQTVGLQDHIGKMEAPPEAESFSGQNAQIIGRGVASFLPTIGVALAAKFGLAKVLEGSKSAENILLKPSALGFSVIESAGTGLATGALLKPTDDKVASDWSSLAFDRATSGLTSALSFGTLSVASFGLSKLAQTRVLTGIGADRVLKSAFGSGLISGAAGGLINVQMESLVSDGKFTADGAKIGKSMYEMAVVGGLFGATTSGLAMLGRTRSGTREHDWSGRNDYAYEKLSETGAGNYILYNEIKNTAKDEPSKAAWTESKSSQSLRQSALDKLNVRFGEGSSTVSELLKILDKSSIVYLPGLADFIEQAPGTRAPLVERVVKDGAQGYQFGEYRLEGLEKLQRYFGEGSPELKTLLAHESYSGFLQGLASFIDLRPESNKVLLQELLASNAPIHKLDPYYLRGLGEVNAHFAGDPATRQHLISTSNRTFEPNALAKYLSDNPQSLTLVKQLLASGANSSAFTQLPHLEKLATFFSAAPKTMERVVQLHKEGLAISLLTKIIEPAPEIYAPTVQAELNNPKIDSELLYDPVAFETHVTKNVLKQYFSDKAALTRLLDSGAKQPTITQLRDLIRFVSEEPTKRPALIEQLLQSGAPMTWLRARQLRGMEHLMETFGADSDVIERLKRLPDLDAGKLYSFIENRSDDGVALVEKLVKAGASAAELEPNRLSGLVELNDKFGEGSAVMKRLLALEAVGLDLNDLSNFVRVDNGKSLVEKLVLDGAGVTQLSYETLFGVAELNTVFGADSATVEKLFQLQPQGLNLASLAQFVTIDSVAPISIEQTIARENARKSLVERELVDGARAEHFDSNRLLALLVLNDRLGQDSPELERVRKMERDNPNLLSALGEYIGASSTRAAVIVQLLKAGATPDQLSLEKVVKLERLFETLKPNDSIARQVLALESQGLNLHLLSSYIEANQRVRRAIVDRLIQDGATAEELSPENLNSKRLLSKYLGEPPTYLEHLLALAPDFSYLDSLADFLGSGGAKHIELVKRIIDEGGGAYQLPVARLHGLAAIDSAFGVNSPVEKHLLALESQGMSLEPFRSFLRADKDLALPKSVIEQMVGEDFIQPSSFTQEYMNARLELTEALGPDSPYLKSLLNLQGKGLELEFVSYFVRSSQGKGLPLLKRLLDEGAGLKELNLVRLEGLLALENMFADNNAAMQRLLELEKQGIALKSLSNFVSEDSDINLPLLKDMLERGFTVKQMDMTNLRDRRSLSILSKRFDSGSDVMKYLDQLQTQGLKASLLAQYIEESPDTRQPIVERLAKNKADLSRFNDQIKLLVFPDHVAERLVEASRNGGLSAAQLLGHLRQWHSGRHFLNLATDQVQSGRSLAASDMMVLAQQAQEMAAADHAETRPSVSNEQTATGSADASDAGTLAAILNLAAERIDQAIPKDRPIVLLGRDMGPVLPLLHAKGRDAQYFLWSTMQGNDQKTMAQWRKEVPPNAAVIDTGYGGTIMDYIWRGDKSASGYLLSKNGYATLAQLLPPEIKHRIMTEKVEDLAKLIGRASTYTEHGGAIARSANLDSSDVATKNHNGSGKNRFLVERELREIFRQAGLPAWDAWRYSQYVGLTPKERLGLNTSQEVEEHYKRVEQLRQSSAPVAQGPS